MIMEKKKQRTLAIFALAIALVATTVAYAVLQTTLNISGSVTKKGGSWDIKFTDVSTSTVRGGTFSKTPAVSGTSLTFNANLNTEGDAVLIKFRVHNAGTLNAGLKYLTDGGDWNEGIDLKIGTNSFIGSSSEFISVNDGVTCGLYDSSNQALCGEGIIGSGNCVNNLSKLNNVNAGIYTEYFTLKCEYTTQSSSNTTIPISLKLDYEQR